VFGWSGGKKEKKKPLMISGLDALQGI